MMDDWIARVQQADATPTGRVEQTDTQLWRTDVAANWTGRSDVTLTQLGMADVADAGWVGRLPIPALVPSFDFSDGVDSMYLSFFV